MKSLFIDSDLKVKFIRGENTNYKITYKKDTKQKKIFMVLVLMFTD